MDAIVGSQIRFKFSSAIAEAELVGGGGGGVYSRWKHSRESKVFYG
jgi:hypothetical protein